MILTRSLDEVMRFLENYTLAWHHWLIVLSLLKLGGQASKSQILPAFKKEGFSPHAINEVFRTDLVELGEAVEVEGGTENIRLDTMIFLTDNQKFRSFVKKHLKSVVRTLKRRAPA